MRTRVNSFRAPEPIVTTASVAVVPKDTTQGQSLEFGLYRDLLERALVKQGFALASPGQAQLHALLSYEVNRVADTSDSGVRSGVIVGSNRGSFGSNVMILDGARKSGWYERKVGVVLEHNNSERQRIYEISAQSDGACGVLSAVIPDMLKALFSEFPMTNGAVKYVSVPVSEKCQ
ncbi:MAG TPA: hypothetical protein VIZ65_13840 [Cellvibrionaceae bacterium]